MIKFIQDLFGVTARRDKENQARALAGQTTSGYLRPGQRDRLFRQVKEPRKHRYLGTLFVTGSPLHKSNLPKKRRWFR